MNAYAIEPLKTVSVAVVEHVLLTWPIFSKRVARRLLKKYGFPHGARFDGLVWYYNGSWEKTIIWRDGSEHEFPEPHIDILEQTILYGVSRNIVQKLNAYNSNVHVNERTAEMTVRCSDEATNFLTMNLVHEIILGTLLPEQAQQRHRDAVRGKRLSWPEMDMEDLQFPIAEQGYGLSESKQRDAQSV